jgi:hypothetical protein
MSRSNNNNNKKDVVSRQTSVTMKERKAGGGGGDLPYDLGQVIDARAKLTELLGGRHVWREREKQTNDEGK